MRQGCAKDAPRMRQGCAVTCGVLPKICKIAKKMEKKDLQKGCEKDANGNLWGHQIKARPFSPCRRVYAPTVFGDVST